MPKTVSATTGLEVGFSLSRPAAVTLAVTAPNGTLVSSTAPAQLDAGPQSLTWDGTTSSGAKAPPARTSRP